MKEKNFFEINNFEHCNSISEINDLKISNNYENKNPSFSTEINASIHKNNENVLKKKNNIIKLISSFVFLLASISIIQTTIKIPIFSDIFNPYVSKTVLPTYCFSNLSSEFGKINCRIDVGKVDDFSKKDYCLICVQAGFDNEEYINAIPLAFREEHKIKIDSQVTLGSFYTFLTTEGVKNLVQNKKYVLVVMCDDKIEIKQDISTLCYVSNVTIEGVNLNATSEDDKYLFVDGAYRYLHIKTFLDEKFKDYGTLYFETTNIETNEKDGTTMTKEVLDAGSYFSKPVVKTLDEQFFVFKVYTNKAHLVDLDLSESVVKDDVTFYLIYSYDEIIKF